MSVGARRRCLGVGALLLSGLVIIVASAGKGPLRAKVSGDLRKPYASPAIAREQIGIFRTPAENVPASVRKALRHSQPGPQWTFAQGLLPSGEIAVWAVPTKESICLVSREHRYRGIGLTCQDLQHVQRDGVSITLLSSDDAAVDRMERLIVGVAPAWASKVSIRTGASEAVVPIKDGVFVRRDALNSPPDTVSLLQNPR